MGKHPHGLRVASRQGGNNREAAIVSTIVYFLQQVPHGSNPRGALTEVARNLIGAAALRNIPKNNDRLSVANLTHKLDDISAGV